jgi:DNA-binding NtrC family response regulator
MSIVDSPPPTALVEAVKAAAQGDLAGLSLLEGVPAELRAAVLDLARACGAEILRLESEEARKNDNLHDLRIMLEGVSRTKQLLRAENVALRSAQVARPLIGAEGGLREVMRLVEKALKAPIAVLLTGETGTGKEVLARYLHGRGPRSDGPFVALNCAAIPEPLLESELFGIDKGVATGVGKRAGKLEQADGGTVFLDEVGDMPPGMQAKILRALQEREVTPIGAHLPVRFDARVISATSRDLEARVEDGSFREDLFYRLVGLRIHVPPLRERQGDIEALVHHFLEDAARRFHCPVRTFSPEAMAALRRYAWPGNVRELLAEVQRAVVVAEGDVIGPAGLTPRIAAGTPLRPRGAPAPASRGEPEIPRDASGGFLPLKEARRRFEEHYVRAVLASERKLKDAAKLLGLTPEGLRKKVLALEIET